MSATEFYTKSKSSLWIYKLVLFKGINGTLIVGLGAVLAGLANENWSQMDGQSRFVFFCGIALSMAKSLEMLIDQTLSRIQDQQKQPPQQQVPPPMLGGH